MDPYTRLPTEIISFVKQIQIELEAIVGLNFIGFYVHGSAAMNGFNPYGSDVDFLLVTRDKLCTNEKKQINDLLLTHSSNPFPIEITSLNNKQLDEWEHPSPFDYHFSEAWRTKLSEGVPEFFGYDPDLAAHVTMLKARGLCLSGSPIDKVFPDVPTSHFLSSLKEDIVGALRDIEANPVYGVLNVLRFYYFIKEGVLASKKEGGEWGMSQLPAGYRTTIERILHDYQSPLKRAFVTDEEILPLKEELQIRIEQIVGYKLEGREE